MISQCFEIKIGLLGHVSVGKTTGLNALLREKFSEVSMKRTTAGINFFRISSVTKSAKDAKLPARDDEESVDAQEENSTGSETSYAKASDTLQETTTDNARLRTTNELQEKIFDIELDEPLLKDMRDDTRLVLVDVPGINEAGTQKIYQDYVSSTWDTFDAMIVVMVSGVLQRGITFTLWTSSSHLAFPTFVRFLFCSGRHKRRQYRRASWTP